MPRIDPDAPAKIDAAIAAAPEFAAPILTKLRTTIHAASPGLVEDWKWSNACFATSTGLVCGFADFKAHVSLHFFEGALIDAPETSLFEHRSDETTSRFIRFTDVSQIDVAPLKRLVQAAVRTEASGAQLPRRTKRDLAIPPGLAAELKNRNNTSAHKFFDALPYSEQREFIKWITMAKRDETKSRRIQQTIDMLSRSERKNEKYRNR